MGYGAKVHLWEDANGLGCDSRVAPKASARAMLKDPRSARGFRSTGQLQKGIGADRSTTERLLLMLWTAPPLGT